jgi:AcrR family transcriptional regulator
MVQVKNPEIRTRLIERAARMLAAREPITLRSLVAGTGVSTMAVYTYFGGMDGLWRAVRQEGFTRLARALDGIPETDDPVFDQAALGAAYVASAAAGPDLYRVMFDATIDLDDPEAADATLGTLVRAVARAREVGRFRGDVDDHDIATQTWIVGHGLSSLVVAGPLAAAALEHAIPMLNALFVGAGDEPRRCHRSVRAGWHAAWTGALE